MMGPGDPEALLLPKGAPATASAGHSGPGEVFDAKAIMAMEVEKGLLVAGASTQQEPEKMEDDVEGESDRLLDALRCLIGITSMVVVFYMVICITFVATMAFAVDKRSQFRLNVVRICAFGGGLRVLGNTRSVSFARRRYFGISTLALSTILMCLLLREEPSPAINDLVNVAVESVALFVIVLMCALIASTKRIRSSRFQHFLRVLIDGSRACMYGSIVTHFIGYYCGIPGLFLVAWHACYGSVLVFCTCRLVRATHARVKCTSTSAQLCEQVFSPIFLLLFGMFAANL